MSADPIEKLRSFLKVNKISDCTVFVAFSGGIDSTALFISLAELKYEFKLNIKALHVNHQLRSQESSKDAEHCTKMAEELKIPIIIKKADTFNFADANKESIELAARNLRYEIFKEEAVKHNAKAVFLAHNLEDQAETLLFRLGRGTGIHGLKGIQAKNIKEDVLYCRPYIETSKKDLELFLKQRNFTWREDSSNKSLDFTRNKIRLKLYPLMKEIFNESFPDSIIRLSRISSSFIDSYREFIPDTLKDSVFPSSIGIIIDIQHFSGDEYLLGELLRPLLAQKVNLQYMIDEQHLRRITALKEALPGKSIDIDSAVKAFRDRGFIIISHSDIVASLSVEYMLESEEGLTMLPFKEAEHSFYRRLLAGFDISMSYAFNVENIEEIHVSYADSQFDFNKVFLGRKSLRNLFSDKSVPLRIARLLPLVFLRDKLILIPGIAGDPDYICNKGKSISFNYKLLKRIK